MQSVTIFGNNKYAANDFHDVSNFEASNLDNGNVRFSFKSQGDLWSGICTSYVLRDFEKKAEEK